MAPPARARLPRRAARTPAKIAGRFRDPCAIATMSRENTVRDAVRAHWTQLAAAQHLPPQVDDDPRTGRASAGRLTGGAEAQGFIEGQARCAASPPVRRESEVTLRAVDTAARRRTRPRSFTRSAETRAASCRALPEFAAATAVRGPAASSLAVERAVPSTVRALYRETHREARHVPDRVSAAPRRGTPRRPRSRLRGIGRGRPRTKVVMPSAIASPLDLGCRRIAVENLRAARARSPPGTSKMARRPAVARAAAALATHGLE